MKTIAFIVPYFGKFHSYFQLWLNSCECNPTIDWLVFTDDTRSFKYPSNVHVTFTNLAAIKEKAESKLGFPIKLDKSYKLCDLKVAYGVIFNEELRSYDFWGFCDIDLIFGDIRKFVTDDILQKNDRIFQWGHCSIFRNVPEVNYFFKYKVDGVFDYERVLQSPYSFSYDEVCQSGRIFNKYYSTTYYKEWYWFDIDVPSDLFLPSCSMPGAPMVPSIFNYRNGKLYGYYFDKNHLIEREYLYVHFQKRQMKVKMEECLEKIKKYQIVPDYFKNFEEISIDNYNKFTCPPLFNKRAIKFQIEYYIDAVFDIKWPKMYERGRLKRIFDKIFFRKVYRL